MVIASASSASGHRPGHLWNSGSEVSSVILRDHPQDELLSKCPSKCPSKCLPQNVAVGQSQWYHFGVGAPPIVVYFSGDWDLCLWASQRRSSDWARRFWELVFFWSSFNKERSENPPNPLHISFISPQFDPRSSIFFSPAAFLFCGETKKRRGRRSLRPAAFLHGRLFDGGWRAKELRRLAGSSVPAAARPRLRWGFWGSDGGRRRCEGNPCGDLFFIFFGDGGAGPVLFLFLGGELCLVRSFAGIQMETPKATHPHEAGSR